MSVSVGPLHKSHPYWIHAEDPSVRVIAANNATANETDTFHRESVGTVGNNIDMAICCLSFVGAIAIILPYVVNRRSRKLRHALILGLATSDLATSVVIIITTACLIANVNLVQHDSPCTFLGYILISSIFSQHLWNLSIAIVTYMILVYPLSSFTLTVERRVRWLWPVFWLVSFVVNAIPFGLGGYGFRGGYCAFTTGFYFASIFQFVPRAIVFVVILCLYTHLFFFLRRTNLFSKANTSNSLSQSRHRSQHAIQSKQQQQAVQQQQHQQHQHLNDTDVMSPNQEPLLANMAFNDALATPADDAAASPTVKGHNSSAPSSAAAHSRKTSSGSRVSPPILNKNDAHIGTRRRSSSLVEKDGSVEMATLKGSESQPDPALSGFLSYSMTQPSAQSQDASAAAPLATYGMLDPHYSMAPRGAAPTHLDIAQANAPRDDGSSISPHSPSDSSYAGGEGAPTLSTRGSAAPLNASFARGSGDSLHARRLNAAAAAAAATATASKRPVTADAGSTTTAVSTPKLGAGNDSVSQRRASAGDSRYVSANASNQSLSSQDSLDIQLMRPRKDAGDFEMITPPVEHLKHQRAPPTMRNYPRMADILAMGEDEMARARQGGGGGSFTGERRGSAVQILPGEIVVEMPSKEAFEESLGQDWKWGMNVTSGTVPKRHKHKEEAGLQTGTSSTSSADENGVDTIGSTLNRQASLLLLLYPAAYCLLFSISIARLSVDLADPGASVRNAHDWLHSLSRWLIFAQGAIDAVIFQFIERQFRQRMKRRRRKAMGENVQDSFTQRVGKKAVTQIKRSWQQTRSRGGQE